MKKQRRTPVTNSTLFDDGLQFAFAGGFSPRHGEPVSPIPRESWAAEIQRAECEEREWWQNPRVPVDLMVELPFWLMVPDGDISVSYDRATVIATIRGAYMDVSVGPMFLPSKNNVVLVGPGDDIWRRELSESVVPSRMPVYRPMKTVVVFRTEAIADGFEAWHNKHDIAPDDHSAIRRVNRAIHYFESLAVAHIPFLNRLITSYRSTSRDPYAFEISEWDVPVWYAEHGGILVRIGLMPYWDSDTYPTVNDGGRESPFFATTLEAMQLQASSDVAPGKLELLDAFSLMYRGRFGDAVRSAVTAIEVAVEAQLANLLRQQGYSDSEIEEKLRATRNNFFDRLEMYERLSDKRLPGPLLHVVPYINGIRLRSELNWVRNLRHRVVHEGIRVRMLDRGPMLRAIETMSWLFEWLSWEDEYGPEDDENYIFFNLLRGQMQYPFEYSESGVLVCPRPSHSGEEPMLLEQDLIFQQYLNTTDRDTGDIELLARMSFEYLHIACEDGPPEPVNEPKLRERFVIRDGDRKAIVFCFEFDGLIETSTVGSLIARVLEYRRLNSAQWSVLVIIHHQRHQQRRQREIYEVVPEDIKSVLDSCGVTVVTALDLQLLVRGCRELNWQFEYVRDLLFTPGRQAVVPPEYEPVGKFTKYFPKCSALSVDIDEDARIAVGDLIGIRLELQYYEEKVCSLQIDGTAVGEARGPGRVGIATTLNNPDLKGGQPVFCRRSAVVEPE
jgi:hypothetical protein